MDSKTIPGAALGSVEGKVPVTQKIAYALGDVGCNFVWTTISSFLTIYYTDSVGLGAAMVGTMMLITRLLDGLTDLAMGVVIDKTNTRWGKARPWILWSAPAMAIGLILLFNVPTSLSTTGKSIYAYVTYIFICAIAYTASNLAYNTLLSLITANQQERTSMNSIRFIATFVTAMLISFVTPPLASAIGFGKVSIIYGALALVMLLITFFFTRENNQPVEDTAQIPLKEALSALFKNKYFVLVTLYYVLAYTLNGISAGAGIYYAKDVLGDVNAFGLLTFSNMIPMILGLMFFPAIAKRFGKWKAIFTGLFISIAGFLIIMVNPTSLPMVLAGNFVRGLGSSTMPALFALVADVVDYGEWKTGVRIDGLTYSATSFGMKVGTGLGSAMVGWILAFGSYNAEALVQSDVTLTAIKALYIYLPIVLTVLSIILFAFMNIDKHYDQISKDLTERRAAAQNKN